MCKIDASSIYIDHMGSDFRACLDILIGMVDLLACFD